MLDLKVFIYLIPSIILGTIGSLLLKKGSHKFTFNIKKFKDNFTIILGLCLFTLAAVLYTIALQFDQLTVIYPLSSISYVLIAFLSVKFLGEKMNRYKWIGIIFIIIGSFLVVL